MSFSIFTEVFIEILLITSVLNTQASPLYFGCPLDSFDFSFVYQLLSLHGLHDVTASFTFYN